ncbi:MAG TPA: amino acid permease, partial [Chthonomonadaceae bacterium]|nr:amino acid permease [Chthonomonadaceae bacterium]
MTAPAGKEPRDRRTPFARVHRLIFGDPIPTRSADEARLPKLLALPVFSSDAISSVAYATQEILLALGAEGLATAADRTAYARDTVAIALAIAILLILVTASYRQTIFAYPSGGGSYIVSKENLGIAVGLVAAAALLIDYVLTVAVSIASGVQNLATIPLLAGLHVDRRLVPVGLAFVLLLTLANLRGQKQAGALFAVPTYLFILSFAVMILTGVVHAALAPGGLLHAVPPRLTPQQ